MTLEYFIRKSISSEITEAISSRGNTMTRFPVSMSASDIIDWLEINGFHRVDNNGTLISLNHEIILITNSKDDKIYHVGKFYNSRPGTCWIQFGNRNVIFTIQIEKETRKIPSWWSPFSKINFGGSGTNKYDKTYYDTVEEFSKAVKEVFG